MITGEASPYYLFHPGAPERAVRMLPEVKIIAVLRDPVMRTYSHWKERRRTGSRIWISPPLWTPRISGSVTWKIGFAVSRVSTPMPASSSPTPGRASMWSV